MDVMENGQQLTSRSAIPQNATAVLLIDDNAIQATTRQAILKRAGYFVIAALDTARVLEQFRHDDFPTPIGAVITDHVMPGMNGAEFVRELRRMHPELPVMVISGMEDAEVEYAGMNVRFLVKPLMPDLLLSNLRELLEQEPEIVA
ncbi:MAG: response regulator [Acidobacteriaceae bacterium]|jgi:DNA-binding NtrC family response regulator